MFVSFFMPHSVNKKLKSLKAHIKFYLFKKNLVIILRDSFVTFMPRDLYEVDTLMRNSLAR